MSVAERSLIGLPSLRREDVPDRQSLDEKFVGKSYWAEAARETIIAHAAHNSPILIEGEPGTGKRFLARLIHDYGGRSDTPFLIISFDSASDQSVEALLFGSGQPARPGGMAREGLVHAAQAGTLYIRGLA